MPELESERQQQEIQHDNSDEQPGKLNKMRYVAADVIRANRHMPLEQLVLLIRRRIIRRVPRYIYRTLLDIETAYDTSYAFTEFRPGA
ncbi:unnamed protein product [Heligmosomoides polygyrus]|uniref:Cyclic nucleotide-binding domain-containing protein n=1 Tax=Heligmosomoides polygyrus TaxID=6339 RepID=A0A183G3N5_HELPZ|nr:unnamed protein product [Heligmosomoides polygyrus]